jgi:NAD(P)-dependent dehydrogenase (short-subunit alcohol dehydrogenase family)
MDLGLTGKSVFITGGSRGIGRACADSFAREGANLALTARTQTDLDQAAQELTRAYGVTVFTKSADMGTADDVERITAEAIDALGGIDILVTCAGTARGGNLEDLHEQDWLDALNIKFLGYLRTLRAVLPHMRQRGSGSIVLVVGNNGLKPAYWEVTGGAANAADLNVAAALCEQYAPLGVRINTVNPGPVNTTRWTRLEETFARERRTSREEAHKLHIDSIPLGRICEPSEVADLVVFLASERAAFINGAHVPIDGGQRKAIIDRVAGPY